MFILFRTTKSLYKKLTELKKFKCYINNTPALSNEEAIVNSYMIDLLNNQITLILKEIQRRQKFTKALNKIRMIINGLHD